MFCLSQDIIVIQIVIIPDELCPHKRLFQFSYYSLIAGCRLSHYDFNVGAEWQEYIDTRTELYEAQMLVNVAIVTLLCIGYYTSCHRTSNLTTQNVSAVNGSDYNISHFVLVACLRQPCTMEVSVLVMHHFYLAVYRKPVGMYVEETHEDADHDAFLMQVFLFHHLFYYNHFAVGRGYHKLVGINVVLSEFAYRTAEEVECNTPYRTEKYGIHVKRYV